MKPLPRPKDGLLSTLRRLTTDPLATLPQLSQEVGDVVFVDMPTLPSVILTNPTDIHQVLVKDFRLFRKDFFTRQLSDLLGDGLLLSEGDTWRRNRRLAMPAFHHQAIAGYATSMVDITESTVAGWGEHHAMDVHHEMMTLTLRIVARTLFGHDIAADASRIGHALDVVMDTSMGIAGTGLRVPSWLPTPSNRRHLVALREVDEVVYRIIEQHRASGDRTSLLGMLLAATDEDGAGLSDKQLRDESITLLMAGHETTAMTLTMALYLLSQHPNVEARLHAELDALGDAPATMEDLRRLPYARCVIKEAMRLYPPAWSVGREPLEDVTIGEYVVPRGCHVMMPQFVVHRDARWFTDPLLFRPERWADGTLDKELPDCAYLPFGAGPRICIGRRFAELEAVLVLSTIARRASLRLSPGETLRLTPSITLRPDGGLRMAATARSGVRVAA